MRMGMRVAVPMAVRDAVSVRMGVGDAFRRRHINDVAVAHVALGDHAIGERLHILAEALQHGDLHAIVLVEMHMHRRLREIVVLVEARGEALGQFARLVS